MSKKKDDFINAMFPGSIPGNKAPQPVVPVEIVPVEDDIIEEPKPVEEPIEESVNEPVEETLDEVPVDYLKKNAQEKKTSTEDNKPKSSKKSFIYFCWTSPEVDYKIREIARRYGISLSAMLGDIMEKAIGNFEKSNGEITVKEKKSKKTARR